MAATTPRMLVPVLLYALVLQFSFIPSVAGATPEATPAVEPIQIVAIGDSIPFAGFCTTCTRAFVADFENRIEERTGTSVSTQNRSRNDGAQLNQIIEQIQTDKQLQKQLENAEIVIISAGFNDGPPWNADHSCGSEWSDVNLRTVVDQVSGSSDECLNEAIVSRQEDFRTLFTAVDELVSDEAQVFVLNAYNAWSGWSEFDRVASPDELGAMTERFAYFYDGWNAQECALAEEQGFECIDLYHLFNGPQGLDPAGEFLEADYSHPNNLGNELIADLLEQAYFADSSLGTAVPGDTGTSEPAA